MYPLCDSACLWALGHHASALPGVGRDHYSHLEQLRSQSRVNMPMESHQEIGLLSMDQRENSKFKHIFCIDYKSIVGFYFTQQILLVTTLYRQDL